MPPIRFSIVCVSGVLPRQLVRSWLGPIGGRDNPIFRDHRVAPFPPTFLIDERGIILRPALGMVGENDFDVLEGHCVRPGRGDRRRQVDDPHQAVTVRPAVPGAGLFQLRERHRTLSPWKSAGNIRSQSVPFFLKATLTVQLPDAGIAVGIGRFRHVDDALDFRRLAGLDGHGQKEDSAAGGPRYGWDRFPLEPTTGSRPRVSQHAQNDASETA